MDDNTAMEKGYFFSHEAQIIDLIIDNLQMFRLEEKGEGESRRYVFLPDCMPTVQGLRVLLKEIYEAGKAAQSDLP